MGFHTYERRRKLNDIGVHEIMLFRGLLPRFFREPSAAEALLRRSCSQCMMQVLFPMYFIVASAKHEALCTVISCKHQSPARQQDGNQKFPAARAGPRTRARVQAAGLGPAVGPGAGWLL